MMYHHRVQNIEALDGNLLCHRLRGIEKAPLTNTASKTTYYPYYYASNTHSGGNVSTPNTESQHVPSKRRPRSIPLAWRR